MRYVEAFLADQHLTRDGGRSTLCGLDREDVWADIPFHDHDIGYMTAAPDYQPCERCADEGDRLQNGPRRR